MTPADHVGSAFLEVDVVLLVALAIAGAALLLIQKLKQ